MISSLKIINHVSDFTILSSDILFPTSVICDHRSDPGVFKTLHEDH